MTSQILFVIEVKSLSGAKQLAGSGLGGEALTQAASPCRSA